MAVKRQLHVKENGEDVPISPHTTADQVSLADGRSVEEVLALDAVAAFEMALNGGNPAAETT